MMVPAEAGMVPMLQGCSTIRRLCLLQAAVTVGAARPVDFLSFARLYARKFWSPAQRAWPAVVGVDV